MTNKDKNHVTVSSIKLLWSLSSASFPPKPTGEQYYISLFCCSNYRSAQSVVYKVSKMNKAKDSGDNLDTFLFTSESVGEGHPGKNHTFSRSRCDAPADQLFLLAIAVKAKQHGFLNRDWLFIDKLAMLVFISIHLHTLKTIFNHSNTECKGCYKAN